MRAYLWLLLVIELPFFMPWLTHADLRSYSALYPAVTLPIAALLPLLGMRQIERRGDRAFWGLVSLAFGLWAAQSIVLSAAYFELLPPFSSFFRDGPLGLFYLAWFVAATVHTRRAANDPLRKIEIVRWLSVCFFAAALIVYCAVPRWQVPTSEGRSGPGMLAAFCLLDFALALRFRWLSGGGTDAWRRSHFLLAMAHGTWLALDLVQGFEVWNELPLLGHPRAEPLWNLPFLLVALAIDARLRGVPEPPNVTATSTLEASFDRGPLAVLVVAAPVGHILLSLHGMLDERFFVARSWIVFSTLLGLAFASAIETRLLRHLAAEAGASRREVEKLRIEREVDARARAAQRAFLANVSHELRTPMSGLLGISDLLLDSQPPGETRERVMLLRSSARQLLRVIDEVLEASRLEHFEPPLVVEPVVPRELVQQVVELLATETALRGLDLEWEVDGAVPERFSADGGRIRQVLTNLLANAIKFTDQGGVSVRSLWVGEIAGRSGRVRFEVEDTGVGIPETEYGKLFQPFSQLDPGLSRRRGGTGLGLAISKRYVVAMGGEIGYLARPGGGSRFWFELPVERPPAAEPAAAPPDVSVEPLSEGRALPGLDVADAIVRGGERPTILLAEDDPVGRLVSEATLRALGYEVVSARDGREALEVASRGRFAAVVLDCQMPEVDGFEVARRLRRDGVTVPIVALTARAFEGDRAACLEAGMDDYLAKPFERAELEAMLARWLAPQPVGR